MKFLNSLTFIITIFNVYKITDGENNEHDFGQCSIESKKDSSDNNCNISTHNFNKEANTIIKNIEKAIEMYEPCSDEPNVCYDDVIIKDLKPFKDTGITKSMIEEATKYGTRYQIINHQLYRDIDCMFPTRCQGIEYFLQKLLPKLPDLDLVINTRDYPQVNAAFNKKIPVFSFSKTEQYLDIMYPAWTFWAGGPAISLFPTGIGRWDLLRDSISNASKMIAWCDKQSKGFFRGSRTSEERDALVLLSRRKPSLVDAQYTKNQAWKSSKDTLNATPAKEVSFEDHCQYKYLFNFRGIAASFRFKHLFLCNSLVFHVGDEWNEFFYYALKPWIHYVPLKSYPSEKELEEILEFFQRHDNLAQEIAQRGYDFIWKHLHMNDIENYWKYLLRHYYKLIKYKIEKIPDLMQIKNIN